MIENGSGASQLWSDWLAQLEFLKYLPDSDLRLHVGFGYYLGAPIERDLWRRNRHAKGDLGNDVVGILTDYEYYSAQVPEILRFSELDPAAKLFSISSPDRPDVLVNSDVVRMQVEAANMHKLGLFENCRCFLEIGAGYGALCAQLVNSGLVERYIIVDLPDVLAVAKRWLGYLRHNGLLDLPVHTESVTDPQSMASPGIYFIDSSDIKTLGRSALRPDVLFNMNSFCEMTTSAVVEYLRWIDFGRLYSSNRERQFMNHEIDALSTLLSTHIRKVWPTIKDYAKLQGEIKKYVFLGSNDPAWTAPKIDLTDLNGIVGREMPSL